MELGNTDVGAELNDGTEDNDVDAIMGFVFLFFGGTMLA